MPATLPARASISSEALPEVAMVRLRRAQPALGLKKGDMGAIVHVYQGGAAYEIEFAASGLNPVLATLEPGDIEPVGV